MSASRPAYAETDEEAADLVTAIHARRQILCGVYGNHTGPDCQKCGTK